MKEAYNIEDFERSCAQIKQKICNKVQGFIAVLSAELVVEYVEQPRTSVPISTERKSSVIMSFQLTSILYCKCICGRAPTMFFFESSKVISRAFERNFRPGYNKFVKLLNQKVEGKKHFGLQRGYFLSKKSFTIFNL